MESNQVTSLMVFKDLYYYRWKSCIDLARQGNSGLKIKAGK